MKPSEILKTAKEKINSPEKWTKGALARDKFGAVYPVNHIDAVCFCTIGVVRNIVLDCDGRGLFGAQTYLYNSLPPMWTSVPVFNDAASTTHADVMSLFDRAISLAESEGN